MIGDDAFKKAYSSQIEFQKNVISMVGEEWTGSVPSDSIYWFSYHMKAMQEELGEVLKADKRWKTHRNETYIPSEKLDEIADVFITAMNLSIFSGYSHEILMEAVQKKIEENSLKLDSERRKKVD